MKAPQKPINKTAEAFKDSANIVGLASAVAISAAVLNPALLAAAAVVEAAYLLFIPETKWFDQRLSAKHDAEVELRRQELRAKLLPTLSSDVQERYTRLETVRNQIASHQFEGKRWFREVLRKLDYLLDKFLHFASKQAQFQKYLESVLAEVAPHAIPKRIRSTSQEDRKAASDEWIRGTVSTIQDAYDREINDIAPKLTQGEYLHNQAILEKRSEVLQRRKQYVVRIGEILENLGHQLSLMEDTFGLINDEIRARSPEQVLVDVDDVVNQTDTLTERLEEVAPFESVSA